MKKKSVVPKKKKSATVVTLEKIENNLSSLNSKVRQYHKDFVDTISKRVDAMEKNGVPMNEIGELKQQIGYLRVTVSNQTRVIQYLLSFMNASKQFYTDIDRQKEEEAKIINEK